MGKREEYRKRAARLRSALKLVDDPIARQILTAIADELDEAAADRRSSASGTENRS
jgi:O-methyltransferase involved in polyketide biosynthesis